MFGILKKYEVHLSPEVNGKITLEGKSISGLEVFRGLTYGDEKELVDKTITDEKGVFSFKEKVIRSRKPGSLFIELRIRQSIDVVYKGKQYILWYSEPIGIEPNKALSEKLRHLNCDLTNPEEEIEFDSLEYAQAGHLVYSVCRW